MQPVTIYRTITRWNIEISVKLRSTSIPTASKVVINSIEKLRSVCSINMKVSVLISPVRLVSEQHLDFQLLGLAVRPTVVHNWSMMVDFLRWPGFPHAIIWTYPDMTLIWPWPWYEWCYMGYYASTKSKILLLKNYGRKQTDIVSNILSRSCSRGYSGS